MNSLIPINYDNPERPTVSGRELHDFLEIKTAYKDWFPPDVRVRLYRGRGLQPAQN